MHSSPLYYSDWLHKQGGASSGRASAWRRRYFTLHGPILRWYEPRWFSLSSSPEDGVLKGEINITGGSFCAVARSVERVGREHCARVVSDGRILYVAGETRAAIDEFLSALSAATGTAAGSSSSSSGGGGGASPLAMIASTAAGAAVISSSAAAGAGDGSWRGGRSGATSLSVGALCEGFRAANKLAALVASSLPATIDIDGPPEVGSELRVRGANIDNLCVAWFRAPAGSSFSPSHDVSTDTSIRWIAGATAQTYAVTSADIGGRIGCSVRPAVGSGGRWSMQDSDVVLPDARAPSLRIRLRPHEHSKYCDRRVRVCTAIGRYREGAVLDVVVRGAAAAADGRPTSAWSVAWYRSPALVDALGNERGGIIGGDGSLATLAFSRVGPRALGDLAPEPPDYEPSPAISVVKESILRASPGGGTPRADFALSYPLFAEDEGTMLVAALVPAGGAAPAVVYPYAAAASTGALTLAIPVGLIEPAPPRAREIWVEGERRVGALLVGHVYYFGGSEGRSVVSWVAIGDDGEQHVIKPAVASESPLTVALPPTTAPVGAAADAHPRALRLTDKLRGCEIKFRVQPVRADGEMGDVGTSRPTEAVA